MKKQLFVVGILFFSVQTLFGQKEKENSPKVKVPSAVMAAFTAKYPSASKVLWEKEDGNYEANWGGSGEDNSAIFSPAGNFIEVLNAIPVNSLPPAVVNYVHLHYKGAKISEAGKITDANGNIFYEAEIKKKDLRFNDKGILLKTE